MKTLLAVTLIALATPATANATLPTVGPKIARSQTGKILRQKPAWRYRDTGYINCRHGKINRTTWTCRIGIARGHRCQLGRSRVFTGHGTNGEIYVYTRIGFGRTYRCTGVS